MPNGSPVGLYDLSLNDGGAGCLELDLAGIGYGMPVGRLKLLSDALPKLGLTDRRLA